VARKLDKADREALSRAALHLAKMEEYSYAAEVYSKMGDMKSLINLHVEAKHWEDVSLVLSQGVGTYCGPIRGKKGLKKVNFKKFSSHELVVQIL